MEILSLQSPTPLQADVVKERLISENNKRAYELLMRIQSQVEANTVIATSFKRESA